MGSDAKTRQPAIRKFLRSVSNSEKPRPDPFARRPNQKCDPYGQGGKPLTTLEAEQLLITLHKDWNLEGVSHHTDKEELLSDASIIGIPTQLRRYFTHPDYITGAHFLNHLAAVAQMNDHFPSIALERKLDSRKKQWTVMSTITFHTFVLKGLSSHDFFVAMVRQHREF